MDDKTIFHEEFVHYLKYAMVVYKREPVVERVIEFAAKFVTSFHQSDTEDEEEEDGGILNYLFTFLLKVLWKLELCGSIVENYTILKGRWEFENAISGNWEHDWVSFL